MYYTITTLVTITKFHMMNQTKMTVIFDTGPEWMMHVDAR